MEIKLSKNNDHDGVSHGVEYVARKATAFPLWRAIDKRWNRHTVSLESSVTAVMRLPISWISSIADWFQAPAVSTATGKMCERQTDCKLMDIILISLPCWINDSHHYNVCCKSISSLFCCSNGIRLLMYSYMARFIAFSLSAPAVERRLIMYSVASVCVCVCVCNDFFASKMSKKTSLWIVPKFIDVTPNVLH